MAKVTKNILISVKLNAGRCNMSISETGVKFTLKRNGAKYTLRNDWSIIDEQFLKMIEDNLNN